MYDQLKEFSAPNNSAFVCFMQHSAAFFLPATLVLTFIEHFYAQSGDWYRMARIVVAIALVGGVSAGIICKIHNFVKSNTDRPLPDIPLIRFCVVYLGLSMLINVGFLISSLHAVLVMILVTPFVLFLNLVWLFVEFGDPLGGEISWHWILHWSILFSWVLTLLPWYWILKKDSAADNTPHNKE